MYLKQLQLKGFKSFAQPTSLVLEPGVTVVVGPNGSGKSNVVDAIGWALGAQAPSVVRSQKMDDVIFAGSAKRAALGRAEVSLTIDNSDGVLPIEFTEVTITRVLFRNGDSEYSLNGVPCRLLDIQELLSDSGVGRQQHVIVSQGQIDAVLNAKPEDRRAVIEEAAGILKYRRRKERSERRLAATEANLTRLTDLLREVRRQLRPLERQADAARRHGAVTEELHRVRVYLAGRRLARLQAERGDLASQERSHREEENAVRAQLAELDARVLAAEAALGALGEQDHGDRLTRYEALREKARGQGAVLAERRRGLDRERAAFIDEGMIAGLESEHAETCAELARLDGDVAGLGVAEERWKEAEAGLVAARQAFRSSWGEGVPPPSGEASEVRGELAALGSAIERASQDGTRVAGQLSVLVQRRDRTRQELDEGRRELEDVELAIETVERELATAEAEVAPARDRLAAAERAAREGAEERSRWTARASALRQALDGARRRAGAERLAGLDGVLGTLLDLVEVDAGWEAAFEAAAGEALNAVVVADPDTARRAIAELESSANAGAVLALGLAHPPRGRLEGPDAVRSHVRSSRAQVDELLDVLVGRAARFDGPVADAVERATADPEVVLVTPSGDCFSSTGWRVGGTHSEATGAALEEADEQARRAELSEAETEAALVRARRDADGVRERVSELSRRRDRERTQRSALSDRIARGARSIEEWDREIAALRSHGDELAERGRREEERRRELSALLPELEAAEAALSEQARRMARERDEMEQRAAQVASLRTEMEVQSTAVEEKRRYLVTRRDSLAERLERNRAEAAAASERRVELDARAAATERLSRFVAERLELIEADAEVLRAARRRQSEEARGIMATLDTLRRERNGREKRLEELREMSNRREVAAAEVSLRVETLTEHCRVELDVEPETALGADPPVLPEGVSATERVRELERDLRLMGPINPLALAEFTEMSERHEFLQGQLDDVRQSRRELHKVIRAVDEEIVRVFAAAYADVSEHFSVLFETLFPGGRGMLRLTEPEDLLNTGIEIEAKPSGKNVRKLSLLSGGERSLTALAYLFAVFRSRPSPFYVMDEVEAALDDVNLHRFLNLVAEFRATAQLIIVSHQKRTMEAADVLYGVTMEPGGSSRVVSERMEAAAG